MTITIVKTVTCSKAALTAAELLAAALKALNAADQDYAVQYTNSAYQFTNDALTKTLQLMGDGGKDGSDTAFKFSDAVYNKWLETGEDIEAAIGYAGYTLELTGAGQVD